MTPPPPPQACFCDAHVSLEILLRRVSGGNASLKLTPYAISINGTQRLCHLIKLGRVLSMESGCSAGFVWGKISHLMTQHECGGKSVHSPARGRSSAHFSAGNGEMEFRKRCETFAVLYLADVTAA